MLLTANILTLNSPFDHFTNNLTSMLLGQHTDRAETLEFWLPIMHGRLDYGATAKGCKERI